MLGIFDLDGTLFETDYANYNSYYEAFSFLISPPAVYCYSLFPSFEQDKRFTRENEFFNQFTLKQRKSLINEKERIYKNNLIWISKIIPTYDEFLHFLNEENAIILTNSSKNRLNLILNHFELDKKPNLKCFCKDDFDFLGQNKYEWFFEDINHYNKYNQIYIFENDKKEFENLQLIKQRIEDKYNKKIFPIFVSKENSLKELKPLAKKPISNIFFYEYHTSAKYYNPSNSNYISDFKESSENINNAIIKLQQILKNTLNILYKKFHFDAISIIPRAKTDKEYNPNQLQFRTTIENFIRNDEFFKKIEYIKIERINSTPTSHKIKNYVFEENYKAEHTCRLCGNVKDRRVLLIDDAYTFKRNICEDMVQFLYDKGAREVIFHPITLIAI